MPTPRITMRQVRSILRLRLESGLSLRECSRVLGVPKSTVGDALRMAHAAGIDWPAAERLDDAQLEVRLYGDTVARPSQYVEPDFPHVHRELKRAGVTLQLLWEEYSQGNPQAYRYTAFCTKYRAWVQTLRVSMRQIHIAGEKLFVDYAGDTIGIIDADTGEITPGQLFVAVLGASNYTFARATATQNTLDWVNSIIDALEFIGGVPKLIVPDQTRAVVARPNRHDPIVNETVRDLEKHYATTVLPARQASPKDKAKVEGAVLIAERWILARLRNRRFFSLAQLNAAIAALVQDMNGRPFKKLPGCRREAFLTQEAPTLRALPAQRMAVARFKHARVNIDYHIEFDHHYYSVPYRLVREQVDLRYTDHTLEALYRNQRVAAHVRSYKRGGFTTLPEHMPSSHRAHREWTPAKLLDWGRSVGVAAAAVVQWQLEHRPHPEQGYRACLGMKRLAKEYSALRLEAACARAMAIHSPSLHSLTSILKRGLDRLPLPGEPVQTSLPLNENVRGPAAFH